MEKKLLFINANTFKYLVSNCMGLHVVLAHMF